MQTSLDGQRFRAAGQRFVEFFSELNRTFVEREELLAQVALALLGREHVLMTGPPGTAKSGLASAVLRRIVDESSRAPSLFSRQFTESTVQTDLVGPINFKTLMETGRTEHFTDEGMLGSVHAFLDEVFDGRDMLLRSTLNVLQERELKQGGKTTRGQIEAAIMTTNRYLAEVLEGSRETLLAFVDRIAFVSFVPKGFGNKASLAGVLKKQLGPGAALRTDLTIQDLDVLQAAVDAVEVPDAVCESLAKLLELLDVELAAATRSDPQFLPTRYLSTRTAVRLGKILRSLCVYDLLFFRPDRALEVDHGDLRGLRLALLLAGPSGETLDRLLKQETDPRERRQLSIVRTEREIFERCLAKVPAPPSKPKKPSKETARLRAMATSLDRQDTRALVEMTQTLAKDDAKPALAAAETEAILRGAVAELSARALAAGVRSNGAAYRPEGEDALDWALALSQLADEVEAAAGATRPMARWLRGRAIAVLDEAVNQGSAPLGETLDGGRAASSAAAVALAERLLSRAEALAHARKKIDAKGAEREDDAGAWLRAVDRLESEVALLMDDGFRADVTGAMGKEGEELEAVVLALAEPLAAIDRCAARIEEIGALGGASKSRLKARVVGPRLRPLVAAAFARVQAPDRVKLVAQVDKLLTTLAATSLTDVVSQADVLTLTAEVLVRSAEAMPRAPAVGPWDREHYRKLRERDQRVPGAFTLLEIALRLMPTADAKRPEESAAAVTALARNLAPELAAAVAAIDVARLERSVTFLERWWSALADDSGSPEERFDRMRDSRFFHVTRDEQALARTVLECKLVREVFPAAAPDLDALTKRLDELRTQSERALGSAMKQRGDAEWALALGGRG